MNNEEETNTETISFSMKNNLLTTFEAPEVLYKLTLRCDWEEYFCVDIVELTLKTTSLVEVAKYAEKNFSNHSLFGIERLN
jgi:hypothetical protein